MSDLKQTDAFLEWLRANIDEVNDERASYRGQPITRDSVAVRYFVCVSMLIDTTWHTTEYYLLGTPEQKRSLTTANAMTLLGGWWSVPGLFYTPFYIVKNTRGGEQKKVSELIEQIQNPQSKEKQPPPIASLKVLVIIVGLFVAMIVCFQVYIFIHKHLPH
jgi:hypothetical protein